MVWIFVGDTWGILLSIELRVQERKNAQGWRGNHRKGIGRTIPGVHTELTAVHLPNSQSREAL